MLSFVEFGFHHILFFKLQREANKGPCHKIIQTALQQYITGGEEHPQKLSFAKLILLSSIVLYICLNFYHCQCLSTLPFFMIYAY